MSFGFPGAGKLSIRRSISGEVTGYGISGGVLLLWQTVYIGPEQAAVNLNWHGTSRQMWIGGCGDGRDETGATLPCSSARLFPLIYPTVVQVFHRIIQPPFDASHSWALLIVPPHAVVSCLMSNKPGDRTTATTVETIKPGLSLDCGEILAPARVTCMHPCHLGCIRQDRRTAYLSKHTCGLLPAPSRYCHADADTDEGKPSCRDTSPTAAPVIHVQLHDTLDEWRHHASE